MGRPTQDHGTMCTFCRALPLSTPQTHAHINMHPLTPLEDFGAAGQQRLYLCGVCNTHWLYQKTKWEACLGFKLWTGDLAAYRQHYTPIGFGGESVEPVRLFRGSLNST